MFEFLDGLRCYCLIPSMEWDLARWADMHSWILSSLLFFFTESDFAEDDMMILDAGPGGDSGTKRQAHPIVRLDTPR
jgi:hypothetical protein